MTLPLLTAINPNYIGKILDWQNIPHVPVGNLQKINGFTNHNHLVDINAVFSTYPHGDIVDRTSTVPNPFKFKIQRPWIIPTSYRSFDHVMEHRVNEYLAQDQLLNLCWSGGHDSTSLVIAFLKHAPNLDQLRILYSPHSIYENREFFEFLQTQYPQLEMLDISGEVYLTTQFEGHVITGHGGDEFTASLDGSFVDKIGIDALYGSWQDYFHKAGQSQDLIDFAEMYFAKSGKSINTVLEARWCYYSLAKSQIYAITDNSFLANQASYTEQSMSGFFECEEFENYMYHNTDQILDRRYGYLGYKQFLKEYIYEFDKNENYYTNAGKQNSIQFSAYINKKIRLLDLRWIFKLSDSTIVRTKNLPFLSRIEFDNAYGNSLDYLFNSPS